MGLETTNDCCTAIKVSSYDLIHLLPFVGGYVGYEYGKKEGMSINATLLESEGVSAESVAPEDSENTSLRIQERPLSVKSTTMTIDMVAYEVRYSESEIELIRGSEVVQVIPWDTSFKESYANRDSFLITNWDINFDNYLDLGILTSVGYGGTNLFYDFYVFNPDTYRLDPVDVFTSSNDGIPLSNPQFDIEQRIITSSMKSGNEWPRWQFIFDGEQYVRDVDWVRIHEVQKDE